MMGGSAVLASALLLAGAPAAAGPGRADFNGLWSSASLTQLERDDAFKTLVVPEAVAQAYELKHRGKPPDIGPSDTVGGAQSEWWERDVGLARIRGQARTSWIVSPADGKLPLTAAAKAADKAKKARLKTDFDGPEARRDSERCIDSGASPPLENGDVNDNFQFVQTSDQLAIYAEWEHDVRIVRIGDKRHPPASVRLSTGDSIGWWEGRTLVVETTNFLPRDVEAANGDAGADQRVIERFTRISPTEIFYEFQVTNPARYVQTWRGEMVLHATKGPIYEYACHEGNYALDDMLRGARSTEAAAGAKTAAR